MEVTNFVQGHLIQERRSVDHNVSRNSTTVSPPGNVRNQVNRLETLCRVVHKRNPSLGPRLSSRRVQSRRFDTRGNEAVAPTTTNRLGVFEPPADGPKEEEERRK